MALRTRDHDPPPLPRRLQHGRRGSLLGREARRRFGHGSLWPGQRMGQLRAVIIWLHSAPYNGMGECTARSGRCCSRSNAILDGIYANMRSPDDLGPVRAEFDEPQLRSDVANTSRNGDSEAARFSATAGGVLNDAARPVIAQKSQKLRDATHLAEQKMTGEEMAPLKGIAECPIAAPSHVKRARGTCEMMTQLVVTTPGGCSDTLFCSTTTQGDDDDVPADALEGALYYEGVFVEACPPVLSLVRADHVLLRPRRPAALPQQRTTLPVLAPRTARESVHGSDASKRCILARRGGLGSCKGERII